MSTSARTEQQLREALADFANAVPATPADYRHARGVWARRQRRRRLILAILIAVVFAIADIVGLWALNQAQNSPHIIFDDPAPVQQQDPAGPVGQP